MSVLKSIVYTFLYILIIELLGTWIFLPELFHLENELSLDKFYYFIQGVIQLLAVCSFIFLIKKEKPKTLFRSTHFKWFIIAVILGVLFIFIQEALNLFYNLLFSTDYHVIFDFDGLRDSININIFSTLLLIPIAEELFFRGFIQKELTKNITPFFTILMASIMFAFIHSPYLNLFYSDVHHDWHLFYITFFGGLLSGFIFYKSNSLLPSIIFHVFWNLTAVIV